MPKNVLLNSPSECSQFPGVARWEQTDDVLQMALVRLDRALQDSLPNDQQHFFRLCTLQIRRTLLDLAKRYLGPEGLGTNYDTNVAIGFNQRMDEAASSSEPKTLEDWMRFHEGVAELQGSHWRLQKVE
jgi:RNA polymerase sigma-70 factor (ECF subfamily)